MEQTVIRVEDDDRPVRIASNAIDRHDPALAREFETAVLEALPDGEALVVRFGLWDGEDDGPRYYCKLEAVPRPRLHDRPAWRWWSPLVRTPAELAGHLADPLSGRKGNVLAPDAEGQADAWGWGRARHAGV
jgi:hypothetical protein